MERLSPIVKSKSLMLNSSLCGYSDVYILPNPIQGGRGRGKGLRTNFPIQVLQRLELSRKTF